MRKEDDHPNISSDRQLNQWLKRVAAGDAGTLDAWRIPNSRSWCCTPLAAIRERHGVEDKHVPYWYVNRRGEKYIDDWRVWFSKMDNEVKGKYYYSGGFFEAKLTKEEILALAEDPDVRSIYPAMSEYKYYAETSG